MIKIFMSKKFWLTVLIVGLVISNVFFFAAWRTMTESYNNTKAMLQEKIQQTEATNVDSQRYFDVVMYAAQCLHANKDNSDRSPMQKFNMKFKGEEKAIYEVYKYYSDNKIDLTAPEEWQAFKTQFAASIYTLLKK